MSYQHQEQVHAPYHFVPLSKWIYMPNWAHLVSHDHPFEDGVSGIIEYTLTNKTPLCVGAEQVKGSDEISEVKWARTPSNDPKKLGTPVIPGSSLKGMIRSVLEIASFGKFNAIDDQHFSFRDKNRKKMPAEKSIKEVAIQTQDLANSDNIFDLGELIFGTRREKGLSIKSRVTFSDATCSVDQGTIKPIASTTSILGQPKASYLSAYLEQKTDKDNVVTSELNQFDSTSQLKGWKRYPVQSKFNASLPDNLSDKKDIQSALELMKEKSQFIGRIVFHNLKEVELGALLWILEFEQENNKVMHSLGHGKPLGAGAVQFDNLVIKANNHNGTKTPNISALVSLFIDNMNQVHPANSEKSWQESIQLKHLFAFADKADNQDRNLTYMQLQSDNSISYTRSIKDKKSLPNWVSNGEKLSRVEQIHQSNPTVFGRGRLHSLIDNELLSTKESKMLSKTQELVKHDNALKRQAHQEQIIKEKMSNMSDCEKLVFELENKLGKAEPTTIAPLIRELMPTFLTSDSFTSKSALQLYQLARKNEYHKKPKKRNKEQKAELVQLVEKYQLKVD